LKAYRREAEELTREYERKVDEKELMIKALEKQGSTMKGEFEKMQQVYKRAYEDNETAKSQTIVERKRGSMLESEIKRLKEEFEEVEKEMKDKKDIIGSLEDEIEGKMRRNEDLLQTVEEKNELILSLQGRVTNLVKRLEQSDRELKVGRDEKKKTQNDFDALKNELQRSEKRTSDLQSALNSQNQALSDYVQKFTRLENEIMGLETDKAIFRQERDCALEEEEKLRTRVQSLRELADEKNKEFEKLMDELKVLRNKLNVLGQTNDLKRKEAENKLEDKDNEIGSLKANISSLKRDYNAAKEQLILLENEVNSSRAEN